jgi:uncharacterized protein (TIGR03067 family)
VTRKLLAVPVLLLLAGVLGAEEKTANKDLEQLQGKWTIETLTVNGNDEYKDGGTKIVLTFQGDKGTFELGKVNDDYRKFTIKIDPSTNPKCMDLTFGDRKEVMEAIYEIKGDELRICVHLEGKNRPTEFAAPEGSNTALAVAKRVK